MRCARGWCGSAEGTAAVVARPPVHLRGPAAARTAGHGVCRAGAGLPCAGPRSGGGPAGVRAGRIRGVLETGAGTAPPTTARPAPSGGARSHGTHPQEAR